MRRALAFVVACVVGGAGAVAEATPTAQDIMNGVERRHQGDDLQAKVVMQVTPKNGTPRLRKFTMMRKEFAKEKVVKLVTFIDAPPDVRGSAFLAVDRQGAEDLRWLYLPANGQVRQLAAESNRQSFFGSDFVYEDLTNRDPDLDNHELVGQQKVDEYDCWVVVSTPKNARGLEFAKFKSWVWKDVGIIVRQEFYDSAGKLIRRGQVNKVTKIDNIWTYSQGEVEDFKTGSKTRMEVSNVQYNRGLPDDRFSDGELSRPPQ